MSRVLLLLCFGLFFWACDDAPPPEEKLRMLVYNEQGLGLPLLGIDEVEVIVVHAETREVLSSQRFDPSFSGGETENPLDELPLDTPLQLQITARDGSGEVVASGGTRPTSVSEESRTGAWFIYMVGVERFAPFKSIFGDGRVGTSLFEGGGRSGHSITLLPDGRVLLAGGAQIDPQAGISGSDISSIHNTFLIFDPQSGYFDLLRNGNGAPLQMTAARAHHTTTPLADGRLLIAGGLSLSNGELTTLRSAEVLQATSSGGFEVLPFAPLSVPRANHTATLRDDGTVLVTGGRDVEGSTESVLASAEVFDPNALKFIASQPMSAPRIGHTATLLADGRSVLITGGHDGAQPLATIEVFSVDAQSQLSFVPGPALEQARWGHAAARVPGEASLIALVGGEVDDGAGGTAPMADIEVLNVLDGRISAKGSLVAPRAHFELVAIPESDDLLAIGGLTSWLNTTPIARRDGERLRFSDGLVTTFVVEAGMQSERFNTSSVPLDNGMILITGGRNDARSLDSAEVFNPFPRAEVAE